MVNDILSDVESRAALFQNSLGLTVFPNQEVALKTGTTNDYKDAWTFVYTKSFVVGVWSGNNNSEAMQKRGSSILAAVPIMNAFMKEAIKDRPTETFTQPDPIFTEKPMLKGEYVVNYWLDNEKLPQIHDLLFYVDKKDPQGPMPANPEGDSQFLNWEEPTIAWARANIYNFDKEYNKPISQNASIKTENSPLSINLVSPNNGSFISNPMLLAADLKSALNIKKLEIYFNTSLIDILSNLGTSYSYRKNFQLSNLNPQNILKVIVTDDLNNKSEKEIILYK